MSECLEGTTERVKARIKEQMAKKERVCQDCKRKDETIAHLDGELRKLGEVIKLLLDTPLPGKALKIAERGLADADSQSVE